MPTVRQPGKLVAELIGSDLALMSPGKEAEINKLMHTKTSIDDYKNLCWLDVRKQKRAFIIEWFSVPALQNLL